MVQAIASGASNTILSKGSNSAALEAQLERYQKELSDCLNCSSAKTSEGKRRIADISGKISDLKYRIQKPGEAESGNTIDHAAGNAVSGTDADKTVPPDQNTANGGARPGSASLSLGGLLDLYA